VSRRRARTPDALRRRRRRRLLLATTPVWIAAIVLGLRLLTVPATTTAARAEYDAGEFRLAAPHYALLQGFPPVERWKAYFDSGTAYYRSEQNWEALDDLGRALELAPDEALCQVQTNLAIVNETAGDDVVEGAERRLVEAADVRVALAARDAGEPYDEEVLDPYDEGTERDPDELEDSARGDFEFASFLYSDATDLRALPGCENQSSSAAAESDEAQDRLDEKEPAAAAAGADPEDQAEPEPAPTGSPAELEAARQADLAERNAEAANGREQELQSETDQDGEGSGGGSRPNW
jgi:tetratricopeptide (TPR) repeat protein